MDILQNIASQISENQLAEAMKRLNTYIDEHPRCAQALFMRGKLHWKTGNRTAAANDYAAAAEIDPDSPAAAALEQARDIESFFNPDILNP